MGTLHKEIDGTSSTDNGLPQGPVTQAFLATTLSGFGIGAVGAVKCYRLCRVLRSGVNRWTSLLSAASESRWRCHENSNVARSKTVVIYKDEHTV